MTQPLDDPIARLRSIMRQLRDPGRGCPWDRQQTFQSIAPYTIEEAYEVADAIDRNDLGALREELGDLLFQVVFHSQMATEAGAFDFADVATTIADKMTRRHPHVFGTERIATAAQQSAAWEDFKAMERGDGTSSAVGLLAGIGRALPSLMRAAKLGKRAARVGFDWPDSVAVKDKLAEELGELAEAEAAADAIRVREELGDILFTAANLARHLGVDPEEALRLANGKFERRFQRVEQSVAESGRTWQEHSASELDQYWKAAKM